MRASSRSPCLLLLALPALVVWLTAFSAAAGSLPLSPEPADSSTRGFSAETGGESPSPLGSAAEGCQGTEGNGHEEEGDPDEYHLDPEVVAIEVWVAEQSILLSL